MFGTRGLTGAVVRLRVARVCIPEFEHVTVQKDPVGETGSMRKSAHRWCAQVSCMYNPLNFLGLTNINVDMC